MNDKDKKLTYEFCGFRDASGFGKGEGTYHYPKEEGIFLHDGFPPPLDLNFYFRYAVPKLQDKGHNVELYSYEHKGHRATIYRECFSSRGSDGFDPYLEPISQVENDDPAEAFGQALLKLIKEGK